MLHNLVEKALQSAHKRSFDHTHAQRSTEWVRALANELRDHCRTTAPNASVAAFCRADKDNRAEFRVNELLFDILVAEARPIKALKGKPLQALSKALWIVESELKRSDSRDVLIDLNKLVVGKADNKLLVISAGTPLVDWTLEVMAKVLDPEESEVFLVTIPHPEHWQELTHLKGRVYQLSVTGWVTSPSSGQPSAAVHVKR